MRSNLKQSLCCVRLVACVRLTLARADCASDLRVFLFYSMTDVLYIIGNCMMIYRVSVAGVEKVSLRNYS